MADLVSFPLRRRAFSRRFSFCATLIDTLALPCPHYQVQELCSWSHLSRLFCPPILCRNDSLVFPPYRDQVSRCASPRHFLGRPTDFHHAQSQSHSDSSELPHHRKHPPRWPYAFLVPPLCRRLWPSPLLHRRWTSHRCRQHWLCLRSGICVSRSLPLHRRLRCQLCLGFRRRNHHRHALPEG